MNTYHNTEAARAASEDISFSFGSNWRKFVATLDESAIERAMESFRVFTALDHLRGETFLDVGCGSGLSSLVALRLGASRVLSFDIDPNSVESTQAVRSRFAGDRAGDWEVRSGSALDAAFMASLGTHSFVYSWGVLHHTGSMWEAIDNTRPRVAPGGRLQLALYNKNRLSESWLTIKRAYNASGPAVKSLMRGTYGGLWAARVLSKGRSPLRAAREYSQARGMNMWRDIEDWLGGLPYEFCTADEVVNRLSPEFLLERLRTTTSNGCNEFLFRRA